MLPLLLNCVGSIFMSNGLPSSAVSRGLGSNVSTCDGPPSMYKKMTCLARAGKCPGRGASGFAGAPPLAAAPAASPPAAACHWPANAARATAPKPAPLRVSISRRVIGIAIRPQGNMGLLWRRVRLQTTDYRFGMRAFGSFLCIAKKSRPQAVLMNLSPSRLPSASPHKQKLFRIPQHVGQVGPDALVALPGVRAMQLVGLGLQKLQGRRQLGRSGGRPNAASYSRVIRSSGSRSVFNSLRAQNRACSSTNGSFSRISAWAGTFDTFRRPTVVAGVGMSKANIIGERKLRRTAR